MHILIIWIITGHGHKPKYTGKLQYRNQNIKMYKGPMCCSVPYCSASILYYVQGILSPHYSPKMLGA